MFARIYVKHFDRDETVFHNGAGAGDNWQMTQTGFRMDWDPAPGGHLTFHGDLYSGTEDAPNATDTNLFGANLVGLWTQSLEGGGGDIKLQTYYDRTDRSVPNSFKESNDTFDLDFQHHIPLGDRQDFTWGFGYRLTYDQADNTFPLNFVPAERTEQLFSLFAQDEIQLVKDKLRLTVGSKFEHNVFTGFEVQPNARLLWNIDKKQSAWAAISRAVRTPSRLEEDLRLNTPIAPGTIISLLGNRDFKSEALIAYEIGYRVQPLEWLDLDIAAFYNSYEDLLSREQGTPPTPPPIVIPFTVGNKLDGDTYGVELGSTVKAGDGWTIRAAYTYLQDQFHLDPGSTDTTFKTQDGTDPAHQVYLRSSMDLSRHLQLDASLRYITALRNQEVPSYVTADVRLAWEPTDHLELAIVGQNLLQRQHVEFGVGATRSEIPRGGFATLTYRW